MGDPCHLREGGVMTFEVDVRVVLVQIEHMRYERNHTIVTGGEEVSGFTFTPRGDTSFHRSIIII